MDTQPQIPPGIPTPPLHSPATNWRMYLELLSFGFFILPAFGNILGPLILWLVKKDTDPVVNEEGKKVINFNISWTIWWFATCGIGFFAWIVISIIATLKAANNEPFRHPWTIAFLK